jgi:hypothetical protein
MDTRTNSRATHWGALQANAHLPEVQAIIRREIACGSIWVTATPGGGIRIVPVDGSTVEELGPTPRAGHEHDQPTRNESVLHIRRVVS